MNEPIDGVETTELAELDPVLRELEAAFEIVDQRQEHWLPNWYLGQVNSIEAGLAKTEEQYKIIKAAFANRRKQLEYRWGAEFQATVCEDIDKQHGKKRSVDYLQGRAGHRAGRDKLVVHDDEKAAVWANNNNLGDAVKIEVTTTILKKPLMEHVVATGEVPDGCEFVPAEDKFYPAVSKPLLPGTQARGMLEDKDE